MRIVLGIIDTVICLIIIILMFAGFIYIREQI